MEQGASKGKLKQGKPVHGHTVSQEHTDAFHIDRARDRDNLHYDSLYSGDVALYRRRFQCQGLSSHQSVELNDGRSKARKSKKKNLKPLRYFSSVLPASSDVIVSGCVKGAVVEPLGDILKLGGEPGISPGADSGSILSAQRHVSQLVGEYNKSLLDNPHNIPLWLEFISQQRVFLEWSHSECVSEGKRDRALREREIAIFERALESNYDSVDLLLGHMTLISSVWEPKRVLKQWKDLVFKQPNVPQLWIGYIDFCLSEFSEFSVAAVTALYSKCIRTLTLIAAGSLKSHSPLPGHLNWMLAIFSRYCDFLRQAGQTEKAVACYKALIEFNICMPMSKEVDPLVSQVEFLEPFWSSLAPRIGEAGAAGWKNFKLASPRILDVVNSDPFLKPELDLLDDEDDIEMEIISSLTVKEAWLQLEKHRTVHHCLPWRGEEEPLDPDRVVLFEDVKPVLFPLQDTDLQLELVLQFLKFLGALVPSSLPASNYQAVDDILQVSPHFVEVFGNLLPNVDSLFLSSGVGASPCVMEADSLTALSTSLSNHLFHIPTFPRERSPAVFNTIVRVCSQALGLFSENCMQQTVIGQVWITHHILDVTESTQHGGSEKEVKARVKNVQKLVKSLLKLEKHRNNVTLWNCCAVVEHLLGHYAECLHIYNTILSSSPSSLLVYTSMVECLLHLQPTLVASSQEKMHAQSAAVNALVCLSEGRYCTASESVSPVRILRARVHYEDMTANRYSASNDVTETFQYGLCHAYFEYVTRGIVHANIVLDDLRPLLTAMAQPATILEKLSFKQARLLLHTPLTKPASLRAVLERCSISNSWFTTQFISLEEQSFISGRLRRFVDQHTRVCRGPDLWVCAVCAELRHYCRITQERGEAVLEGTPLGCVRRALSLLERATESRGQSPLIWRLYMAVQVKWPSLCSCIHYSNVLLYVLWFRL